MMEKMTGFLERLKKMKTGHKVGLAILLIVICVVLKVLTAQFLYTEIGYAAADNNENFRMALSVSPFTARAFDEGYTYEYEGRQISSIEELEQLYIDHFLKAIPQRDGFYRS